MFPFRRVDGNLVETQGDCLRKSGGAKKAFSGQCGSPDYTGQKVRHLRFLLARRRTTYGLSGARKCDYDDYYYGTFLNSLATDSLSYASGTKGDEDWVCADGKIHVLAPGCVDARTWPGVGARWLEHPGGRLGAVSIRKVTYTGSFTRSDSAVNQYTNTEMLNELYIQRTDFYE